MLLNSRTLAKYPDGATFVRIRLTYPLRGDRLLWTRFERLTKAQILAMRKQDQGRTGLRWEGEPES